MVEVVLDSGGAKTMIDKNTARLLNLDIEWATEGKSYGSFSGVSAQPTQYLGRSKGPVEL
jgi:hypothetical protein